MIHTAVSQRQGRRRILPTFLQSCPETETTEPLNAFRANRPTASAAVPRNHPELNQQQLLMVVTCMVCVISVAISIGILEAAVEDASWYQINEHHLHDES